MKKRLFLPTKFLILIDFDFNLDRKQNIFVVFFLIFNMITSLVIMYIVMNRLTFLNRLSDNTSHTHILLVLTKSDFFEKCT